MSDYFYSLESALWSVWFASDADTFEMITALYALRDEENQ